MSKYPKNLKKGKEMENQKVHIKYADFVKIYMKDCEIHLRPTSFSTKKYIFEKHIIPYFQNMYLDKINIIHIRNWQNLLIKNHNYSALYLQTLHNQISAGFNFACKYYNLEVNPLKIIGSIGQKYSNIVNFWTLSEFKKFIKYIENDSEKLAFNVLFWTGIRVGELLALSRNDFNFQKNIMHIHKNYSRLHKKDLILPPKTPAGNRSIGIPEFLSKALMQYINTNHLEKDERLFNFSKYYLYLDMDKICKKIHLKKIRIHDLRHSHASLLLNLNFSPSVIADRLGHESINTTMKIYSHLYPDIQIKISNKLNMLNQKNI